MVKDAPDIVVIEIKNELLGELDLVKLPLHICWKDNVTLHYTFAQQIDQSFDTRTW